MASLSLITILLLQVLYIYSLQRLHLTRLVKVKIKWSPTDKKWLCVNFMQLSLGKARFSHLFYYIRKSRVKSATKTQWPVVMTNDWRSLTCTIHTGMVVHGMVLGKVGVTGWTSWWEGQVKCELMVVYFWDKCSDCYTTCFLLYV